MTDFIVTYKKDNSLCTVYDIRNDKNGFPQFLIYTEGQWKYISAKNFTPINIVSHILNRLEQPEQEGK